MFSFSGRFNREGEGCRDHLQLEITGPAMCAVGEILQKDVRERGKVFTEIDQEESIAA